MIKKILVTGASGYIGSVLTPMLLKKGYHVKVIDRFFFGNLLPKHKNLKIIKCDTRNLKQTYFLGIDAVIDLAALSNDPAGEYFKKETYDINFKARYLCARFAKKNKIKKYILPSSCSIYGFNKKIVNELSPVNPLTTYAKANFLAEKNILKLADNKFCVTVLRQSTIFGYSPRMRYDLALNGMVEGAYRTNSLPIMRNGKQIRPLLHLKDTARAIIFMLRKDPEIINKQIYNVGSKACTKSVLEIANVVKKHFSNLKLNWYGTPDVRSYNVDFTKIEKIGYKIKYNLDFGVKEILNKLKNKKYKSIKSITLDWYKSLEEFAPYILNSHINKKIIKF